MKAVSHSWDYYNSVTKYQCNCCDKSVDLIPLSHIGYTLMVGVLAVSFGIYIFVVKSKDDGFLTYATFTGLILFQLFLTASQYSLHRRHPPTNVLQNLTPHGSTKGFRNQIERIGFLGGLLLPIGLAALLLGSAIALGIVHDHFFPPP